MEIVQFSHAQGTGKDQKPRILIVDDSPGSRELLRSILDGCGYDLGEVVDGSEVLACATAFEPHLVILDVQMPMLEGCTSAILLRSQPAFEKIPIIALTAAVSDISADRIAEAGFTMHLVKPIGPARLRRCVAGLLERVP